MEPDLSQWALPEAASAILVALGAGLMISIERERRMKADNKAAAAGVRTHAITALLGVLAALSGSQIVLGAIGLGVVALTALSYRRTHGGDPGLTSEMAL